jgi:endonuclease-3
MKDLPLAEKRQKMAKCMQWLRSAYPRPAGAPDRPALDQLILEHLKDELGARVGETALGLLQEQFVDWNEVRVSRDVEFERALGAVGFGPDQAQRLRTILSSLFDRTNALSLEAWRGKPLHETEAVLTPLGVSRRAANATALLSLGLNTLALESGGLRVLQRLEMVETTAEADTALGELSAVVAATDRADFYWLFLAHAKETCRERGPMCSRCVLLRVCPTGQARTPAKPAKKRAVKKGGEK